MARTSGPSPRPASVAPAVSADLLRLLVDRVQDYAIFLLDPTGKIASWNAGARRIKQYEAEEIVGQHMSIFYTSEDAARGHPAWMLRTAMEKGSVEEEGWRVRKDGTRFWADVVITALRDDSGELKGFAKVTRDLTERRTAEIALSELSGRLLQLQDDERRRIARELHDSTSPLLTGLINKLYSARQRLKGRDDPLGPLVEDALSSAEAASTMMRSVSSSIHPPLLDESGLLASLKWYASAFEGREGIRVEQDFPPKLERMDRNVEVALFRAVQEGLNSVIRGAGGKKVRLRIRAEGELTLELFADAHDIPAGTIADIRSGRGDIGIGVSGMRERMRQIGGRLEIGTTSGGLTLTAILPRSESGEYGTAGRV